MKYPEVCPHCNHKIVMPGGPSKSKFIIVGENPGVEEIKESLAWVGSAGKVLRRELALLGIDLSSIRHTNIWVHESNKNDEDRMANFAYAYEELKGREVALLVGSEVAKWASNNKWKVSDLTGLELTSEQLGNPLINIPHIIFSVNPAIVLHSGGIGETRLAIRRFGKLVRSLEDD